MKIKTLIMYLCLLGGIVWLGGSVVRAAIVFDVFIPGTVNFKPDMNEIAALQTLRLFGLTAFYTVGGYAMFILTAVPIWFTRRSEWKSRGWIFISGVIVCLYIPVEIFQMIYDVRLALLVQADNLTLELGREIILRRLTTLSGVPLLAMLGYCSALWFMVAQPMQWQKESSAHSV